MSEAVLRDYLRKIEKAYQAGNATEHTYRPALQELLETLHSNVIATNEPKRVKFGAPDYVIERNTGSTSLTIGYVEAKDVDVALDTIERDSKFAEPKTRDGKQLKRYLRAIDNLVFTNYVEFRWYVQGEKIMTAALSAPRPDRRLSLDNDGAKAVANLLDNFLHHSPQPIRKPHELALRMARLAHMIRDIIIDAFEQKQASGTVRDLYTSFKETLLPELTEPEFADMFAQTLAYGLFAARYNHKSHKPFRREDAVKEIPRTNPFLRKLFGTIAGADLDDEPYVGFVDELAQTLAVTDMDAVLANFGKLTRREDPIVHFYETFLTQYDPKLRELRGVYYTPEPVVSYIVRSVDHLLRTQFACPVGLADTSTVSYTSVDESGETQTVLSPRVLLLDPACGTGTFLYNVIEHIRDTYRQTGNAGMWSGYVRQYLLPRLFGFELLMAPYAMAHLKLGMQLAAVDLPEAERATWAYDFQTDERLGLYLTNTLEEAIKRSEVMFGRYISEEANEAAKVKQGYPVMVVIGNPPYSGHSANKGEWITNLLHGREEKSEKKTGNYFEVDGKPLGERNPKWLNDDYVKFIRFAQWRIARTGYGILAFITNHGYLDNPTFRGMRQSLMQTFDDIYVLNLHGNSKKKERSPDGSKDENVFDIQQGVAIGIFVKREAKTSAAHGATVRHADLWGPREVYQKVGQDQHLIGGKYHWLAEHDITTTEWKKVESEKPFYLFVPQDADSRAEYEQGWKVTEMMPVNVLGFQTHRDHFAIDFDKDKLRARISEMRDTSLSDQEYAEKYNLTSSMSWVVGARRKIRTDANWQNYVTRCLYRPFDSRYGYFNDAIMDRPRTELRQHMLQPNISLNVTRQTKADEWRNAVVANSPTPALYTEIKDGSNAFPLYLYPQPDKNTLFDTTEPSTAPGGRCPNLSPAFITAMEGKLGMRFVQDGKGVLQATFGPEDVLDYTYAVLYSPMYRSRYAEFLKIDFPRLPLTSDVALFRKLCGLGERLVALHLMEQTGTTIPMPKYPVKGNNVVEKVEYLYAEGEPESGRVSINKTQYFEGVPPDVWEFHVGGYQVCQKWLKDRKGRALSFDDIRHYQNIVMVSADTIALMEEIDEIIEEHGGWPIV